MSLLPPRVLSPQTYQSLIPSLAQLHCDCIMQDHTVAKFLPPLDLSKVVKYWEEWLDDVKRGLRDVIVQTTSTEGRASEEVVGVVTLYMPPSETGPFRGMVQGLLVSSKHRYKGVARAVMGKMEEAARAKGKFVLVLDTTIGSGAEFVYPKLGYREVGVIPNYSISPEDGTLRDEVFFYKDLRESNSEKQASSSEQRPTR